MKKQQTHYHIILDQSGSMQDCKEQTISGFNEQLQSIQTLEEQFPNQEITVGLTLFNTQVMPLADRARPADLERLTPSTYLPNGGTALFDAIGLTVQKAKTGWLNAPPDVAATVMMVIITDGYENSSRVFRLPEIRDLVTRLEGTGQWTFLYLGATLDAVDVAESMAIHRSRSAFFDKRAMESEVWDRLGKATVSYFEGRPDDIDFI